MKKPSDTLTGVLALLFYYFVMHLMLYWEYNEKYAIIQNAMLFVLPALPGVALAVLLVRDSLKDFFKSWGACFLGSTCVFLINILLRVDLMIHTCVTGLEEFSLGDGILMFITDMSYIAACFIGVVIAGIVTLCKQRKNKPVRNNE